MTTEKPQREIISPEGVEERVEYEITFRLTLTGGGKYRTYIISEDRERHAGGEVESAGVFATEAEALKRLGSSMIVAGSMIVDPVKTIERLVLGLHKPPHG